MDKQKLNSNQATFQPYPKIRRLMADGGRLGLKKHVVHGLVEMDITEARNSLRLHRAQTGEAISFTAFFLSCLGKAIDRDKNMQAYKDWRNRLVTFDEVDINMLFEVVVDGQKTIRPHILRGVNRKSPQEIHQEIRDFQNQHQTSREATFIDKFVLLPGLIRRLVLKILLQSPKLVKEYYGTVLVSSLGMFGTGSGWGIPVPNHTLQLTLGGMTDKPTAIRGEIQIRKIMNLTISFDHDLIDGAPAARFSHHIKKMIEAGFQAPSTEDLPG